MVLQKKIGLDRNDYKGKNVLKPDKSDVMYGQYAGLQLIGFGFDAVLGFDFIVNALGF